MKAKEKAPRAQNFTKRTQQLLAKIETRLGHPLVVYWTSTTGSICQNDGHRNVSNARSVS